MLRVDSEHSNSENILNSQVKRLKKKLVIVGDGSSGKTCLLQAQAGIPFSEDYVPTIFENYSTPIQLGKNHILLSLWDTAGQEDYDRLRPLSYPDTDVVIITFAVDQWDSHDNVTARWVPEIKHFLPNAPIILVATKVDLRYDRNHKIQGGSRTLTEEEGLKLASIINAKYFECSAKFSEGVAEIFQYAAKVAVQGKRQRSCKMI